MPTTLDLRCPSSPRRLFAKLRSQGVPTPVVEGNLIEMKCSDCLRGCRESRPLVVGVYHHYNFLGECIGTEFEYRDGAMRVWREAA